MESYNCQKAMQATHKQKLEGSTFRGGVQMMVVYTQCCDEFVDDKKSVLTLNGNFKHVMKLPNRISR